MEYKYVVRCVRDGVSLTKEKALNRATKLNNLTNYEKCDLNGVIADFLRNKHKTTEEFTITSMIAEKPKPKLMLVEAKFTLLHGTQYTYKYGNSEFKTKKLLKGV
jgi:hypothetical protein